MDDRKRAVRGRIDMVTAALARLLPGSATEQRQRNIVNRVLAQERSMLKISLMIIQKVRDAKTNSRLRDPDGAEAALKAPRSI